MDKKLAARRLSESTTPSTVAEEEDEDEAEEEEVFVEDKDSLMIFELFVFVIEFELLTTVCWAVDSDEVAVVELAVGGAMGSSIHDEDEEADDDDDDDEDELGEASMWLRWLLLAGVVAEVKVVSDWSVELTTSSLWVVGDEGGDEAASAANVSDLILTESFKTTGSSLDAVVDAAAAADNAAVDVVVVGVVVDVVAGAAGTLVGLLVDSIIVVADVNVVVVTIDTCTQIGAIASKRRIRMRRKS